MTLPWDFRVKTLFLTPPVSLHHLSCFRRGKMSTASGSSVSGSAHASTTSRHPVLPSCCQSSLGISGLPLRHVPACMSGGNLPASSAFPVHLHTGPACHSSLFKMAKRVVVQQCEGGRKRMLLLLKKFISC